MEISRQQLDKLIRERAKVMAKRMFLEQKSELKAQFRQEFRERLKTGADNSSNVYHNLSESELNGRRLQVFNTIKESNGIDRHTIAEVISNKGVEISAGSVSGRLAELTQSGLIEVVGFDIGKFGKNVSIYKVVA